MRRLMPPIVLILALIATGCSDGVLTDPSAATAASGPATQQRAVFPDLIPLPDGFQPEGIAIGPGTRFYAGSLADGSIYSGDLRTGEGSLLVADVERVAVGLDVDKRGGLLWVSGGATGEGYVYDARTGEPIQSYDFGGGFVNDVIVTRSAAYFTDSFRPVLYRVALSPTAVPGASFDEVALGGEFVFVSGEFNTNGIVATPDGGALIIVNTATGTLYSVDPETGVATAIDLGGGSVPNGDGLLLHGRRTLYVVQNFLNQIAVVELSPDLGSGEIADELTDPRFRIPTTAASFGNALYVVNARFDTTPTSETDYEVVRLEP